MSKLLSISGIPDLTTEQMVEVDRAMIEDYRIELIQMMENAGRNLAHLARTGFSMVIRAAAQSSRSPAAAAMAAARWSPPGACRIGARMLPSCSVRLRGR